MIFDDKPTIIGHRGHGKGTVLVCPPSERHPVTATEPGKVAENTIESCLAAIEAGLSWIEIDVQRTADDELVLRHDPVTPEGEFIVEHTAAEVSAHGLPKLADVFAALPTEVAVDVDVKTVLEDAVDGPARRTGALLAHALAGEASRRRLFVSSFDSSLLLFLRESLPEVPLGLLTWINFPIGHGIAAAANLGLDAVGLHTGSFGSGHRSIDHSVDVAHQAGLEVMVWCPNPDDTARYVRAGVDALVVNDVPGVLAALARS